MRVRMFIVQVYAYSNNDEIPFIVEKLQKKDILILNNECQLIDCTFHIQSNNFGLFLQNERKKR